jgi:hypothetical protein
MASPPIGRGCNLRSTSPRTRTEGHETSGDSSPSQMSTVTRPKASYRLPKVVSRSTEPFWSEARPKRREETKRARPARPCRSGRYKYAGAAAASLGRKNTNNRHWSERASGGNGTFFFLLLLSHGGVMGGTVLPMLRWRKRRVQWLQRPRRSPAVARRHRRPAPECSQQAQEVPRLALRSAIQVRLIVRLSHFLV